MVMSRRDLLRCSAIGVPAVLVTMLLGFGHWGPWPQLLTVVAVGILASLGAPEAFGWRPPRTRSRR